MRFKSFEAWENPHYEDPFTEKYQRCLEKQEAKMAKEGLFDVISAEDFWEYLYEKDLSADFDTEIEKMVDEKMNSFYYTSFNSETDMYHTTPEYKKVEAEFKEEMKEWRKKMSRAGAPRLERMLVEHFLESHYADLKKIYQKWLDIVIKKRGTIIGKKFGF